MDYLDFLDSLDFGIPLEYEERAIPSPRRYIRDMENPIEHFDDAQFKKRFRFHKETVMNVLVPLIFPEAENTSRRGLPIPPILQMCVALRYYASDSFQTVCGDTFHISQPTVHRISKHVSEKICRKIGQFIKMPQTDAEIQDTWRRFYQKARFPKVIGLIDGTHIPIISPGGDQAEVFRNRKGFFSINVQVVTGPRNEILDIVCRWPGSAHDSRVFESSAIKQRLEENPRLGHLLGDAGYGQKPYLFTPLTNPVTDPEKNYNRAHKTTRSSVERTIGRWKRRFPCLYFEMQTKLLTHTLRIICASAVLYNIGINVGDLWNPENDDLLGPNRSDDEGPFGAAVVPTVEADVRSTFINQYFT